MKIALIQPPIEDFYITPQRLQPTALLYLATFLEQYNYSIKIFDFLKPLKKTKIALPDELNYLNNYYKKDFGPDKIFYNYFHFGQTHAEIENVLRKEHFDVYGISSNFTAYFEQALKIAEIIKKINKHAFIIIGGNNSRIMYEYFLQSGFVNVVVFGEGEFTLLKLLKNIDNLSTVENIAYIENKKVLINPFENNFDINKTIIQLDKINPDNYKIGKFRSLSIITAKGCPYQCSYCTANINCLSPFQQKDNSVGISGN